MRLVNLAGRLHILDGASAVDVQAASDGRFDADPQAVYPRWDEFLAWEQGARGDFDGKNRSEVDLRQLGPPVPSPRQVFAVGLNYGSHADESGFIRPSSPVIFTKFPSSLSGPISNVRLPGESVDWEVELVVVCGTGGRGIAREEAWESVAGVCVGQDLSEREGQHSGPAPQFSLAKSHEGFSPIGPAVVTVDELPNHDDLELSATIDGEEVQRARTSQMIFSVPELIADISSIAALYPGDLIFTGTPAGVGAGRNPPRFLQPGETLRSCIEGLGELVQTFVA